MRWEDGAKIWCVFRPYGSVTLCDSRDNALDEMTRKDTMCSFIVSDFKEEKV